MSSKYTERVIDDIYDELTDNTNGISTKISSLNTELTDLTLLDIPDSQIYKGPFFVEGQFPCICIWPENATFDDDTNTSTFTISQRVVVWVVVSEESDQFNLHKRIWRYQRGIIEVMRRTWGMSNDVDNVFLRGLRLDNPWLAISENLYIEAGGVEFEIRHEEEI